jgi:FecR-like protein/PEGA domain-containing protein
LRGRYGLAAAAAVLLLVGASMAVGVRWLVQRPGGQGHQKSPTADQTVARVHLSAGAVRLDDAPAEVGLAVRSGQTLRVTSGRATLALPDAAAVLIESDSALRVDRLTPRATTLRLDRGKLLASVRPRPGRPLFTVVTTAGRVEVTGTVFSVEHTPRGVVVAVLRGQVRVREHGQPVRLVASGMRTLMRATSGPGTSASRGAIRPMDATAQAEAWGRVRVLELVHADHTAKVTIQSRPTGARVLVNGLLLGQTPLVTRLRAGHHRVELRKVGHRPAVKQLRVSQGGETTWDAALTSAFHAQRNGPTPKPALTPTSPPGPSPTSRVTSSPHGKTGTPPKPPTPSTAKDLAQRARQQRRARDWRGAAKTFAELIRRHPRSGRARTARVSLGLILLDRLGDARGGLAQFSAYLTATRVGALAQEASYGQIRALRRLGRRGAEIRALRAFLRLYPRAIHGTTVRRRLKRLGEKLPPPTRQHMGLGTMGGVK